MYKNITDITNIITSPDGSEILYFVKDGLDAIVPLSTMYLYTPDFYKYSIVRTVVSGNLTVTLKNYEGNDPTVEKPVKIMIDGVIRTITSALSVTSTAGSNNFNAGSAELATKEIDYFVYLGWNVAGNNIALICNRKPSATTNANFTISVTDENGVIGTGTSWVSTDPVVNIGRFNAILSAGAGYTWSLPATSIIINNPIYETRFLVSNANRQGFTASGSLINYKITGSMVNCIFDIGGTSNATTMSFTLPFAPITIGPDFPQGLTQDNGTNKTSPGRCTVSGNTVTCFSDLSSGAWTSSGSKLIRGQFSFII